MALKPSSVSTRAKEKLAEVAPHPRRCLITCEEHSSIEVCHILSPSTNIETLRHLEYSWGMQPGQLNVDTTNNLIYHMHRLYDAKDWALVPTLETLIAILKEVEEHSESQTFKSKGKWPFYETRFPRGMYKYHFVPFAMRTRSLPIFRYELPQPCPHEPAYTRFDPPFSDFPLIESHAHPYFVICNAAQKAHKNVLFVSKRFSLEEQNLTRLTRDIYDIWDQSEPSAQWLDLSARAQSGPSVGSMDTGPTDRQLRSHKRARAREDDGQAHNAGESGVCPGASSGCYSRNVPEQGSTSLTPELTADIIQPGGKDVGTGRIPTNDPARSLADDPPVHLPYDIIDWADGAAAALARGELAVVHDNENVLREYAQEKTRKPPTTPWHSWRTSWAVRGSHFRHRRTSSRATTGQSIII